MCFANIFITLPSPLNAVIALEEQIREPKMREDTDIIHMEKGRDSFSVGGFLFKLDTEENMQSSSY